jgi:voltage-gated potassium channel
MLFAIGFYFAEHNTNEQVHSFGQAVWWCLAAIETMGTPYKPITLAGQVVGGIWAILGVISFWGTIIASITAYFMRPRQRPTQQIISTVQYNLEQLEDLSLEELDLLKETTDGIIDAHIGRVKQEQSSRDDSKAGGNSNRK